MHLVLEIIRLAPRRLTLSHNKAFMAYFDEETNMEGEGEGEDESAEEEEAE